MTNQSDLDSEPLAHRILHHGRSDFLVTLSSWTFSSALSSMPNSSLFTSSFWLSSAISHSQKLLSISVSDTWLFQLNCGKYSCLFSHLTTSHSLPFHTQASMTPSFLTFSTSLSSIFTFHFPASNMTLSLLWFGYGLITCVTKCPVLEAWYPY